jgi:transposase
MLADELDFVVGVDPHRDSHAIAVVDVRSGVVVFESSVSADSRGYAEALRVAEQHAPGRRAFAVEGTGSFGAGLTRFLADHGEQVFEVGRLRRERRSGGKTDALDAARAARSVFEQKRPATPRSSGEREALRALVAAREGAVNAKRAGLCQLRDLLITTPEPLRSQLRPLSRARLLSRLAATRPERRHDPELRGTLLALRAVARRVQQLTAEERELAREIEKLTSKLAPQLLTQPGIGPLLAAQVVLSWSHRGRLVSEAAFARLAGAAPIPASSGHDPLPARPQRRQTTQPSTPPDRRYPTPNAPTDHRLDRAANPRRKKQPGGHPLPQTLPRPKPVPTPRNPAADDVTNIEASPTGFYGAANDALIEPVRKRQFPIVGDGGGYSSWIHLDDAAAATVLALEHDGPAIYNIVDDKPAPVREWLPVLADALGAKPPRHVPVWLARLIAGDVAVIMGTDARAASNAKAKRELGFTLRYPSWRQGFAEVYAKPAASTSEPRSPASANVGRPRSASR